MTDEQKKKDYRARQERLKQVAENIDRGVGGKFYGADFHLAFNYMFNEMFELQREFNQRFTMDMPHDPRFAEFYNRITQIMESSEIVLVDSIDPNARKRHVAELSKQYKESETPIADAMNKLKAQQDAAKKATPPAKGGKPGTKK